MKTKKLRTTTVHLITFALIFTLGMATSIAQEKFQIAGKQTLAFTKQERSFIGDVEEHALSLVVAEGVNLSTGATDIFDGAQAINYIISDLVSFSGPIQGYSVTKKGKDSLYATIEGTMITTISSDGSPLTTIEATMNWIKGTGKYENIKGSGTAKGRYIAANIYVMEWEGEYWIEK